MTKYYLFSFFLALSISAAEAKILTRRKASNSVPVAMYFPGKDELCLDTNMAEVKLTVSKLVHEIDVHSDADRESHCTISGTIAGDKKVYNYSMSGSRCDEWLKNPKQVVTLATVAGHVCALKWDFLNK